jgi:hypothetical protein
LRLTGSIVPAGTGLFITGLVSTTGIRGTIGALAVVADLITPFIIAAVTCVAATRSAEGSVTDILTDAVAVAFTVVIEAGAFSTVAIRAVGVIRTLTFGDTLARTVACLTVAAVAVRGTRARTVITTGRQ